MGKTKKAKVIKNKKKFPWGRIWYYIKSLFDNSIAMECGMKSKWYVTALVFVFSLMVSIVPITVQTSQTSGSSFVNTSYNDPYYYGLNSYMKDTTSSDINFKDGKASSTWSNNNKALYTATFDYEIDGTKDKKLLEIFYVNLETTDANFVNTLNNIRKGNYNTSGEIIEGSENVRNTSFILFTPTYFEAWIYKLNSSSASGSISGDYNCFRASLQNKSFKEILNIQKDGYEAGSANLYLNNFYDFAHDVYINNRTKYTWINFGIVAGLNAGITLLMGLLFFVMTRGKNNPLKTVIKWYHGFGIASWLMISPAILSLILGFTMSQLGMIFYVLFFGIRSMWLSMKNLKPQYTQN